MKTKHLSFLQCERHPLVGSWVQHKWLAFLFCVQMAACQSTRSGDYFKPGQHLSSHPASRPATGGAAGGEAAAPQATQTMLSSGRVRPSPSRGFPEGAGASSGSDQPALLDSSRGSQYTRAVRRRTGENRCRGPLKGVRLTGARANAEAGSQP